MSATVDWSEFGKLIIPGIVVGLVMLTAQVVIEIYRHKRKLIAEEVVKMKTEAFLKAIELVDRQMASTTNWSGPDVPKGYQPIENPPSALEINSAYAQLMISAEESEIPQRFVKFFAKREKSSPQTRAEFILLLRKELFGAKSQLNPKNVPWFF